MAHPPCDRKKDAHPCVTCFVTQMRLGCPVPDFPLSPSSQLTNRQELKDRSSCGGSDPHFMFFHRWMHKNCSHKSRMLLTVVDTMTCTNAHRKRHVHPMSAHKHMNRKNSKSCATLVLSVVHKNCFVQMKMVIKNSPPPWVDGMKSLTPRGKCARLCVKMSKHRKKHAVVLSIVCANDLFDCNQDNGR